MNERRPVSERVTAEKEAHEVHDVLAESTRLKDRFSHIRTYPSRKRLESVLSRYLPQFAEKTVLDLGCGRGETSLELLEHGATVFGIDIAENYVAAASQSAAESGFSADRFRFETMDAHELRYDADTFDAVIGNGILHHLDADIAMVEIHRVLKPGGRVLLWEPLADNPLLKLFRRLTPAARTRDEKPFADSDVHRLADTRKWRVELDYCGIVEAPAAVITSILLPKHPANPLLRAADVLERWLHEHRILQSWNQYVLFNLVKR